MLRPARRILALLAILCAASRAVDLKQLPKPTGYVSDLAHVVNPADREQLEEYCTKVEQQLGVQFALVTVDTLDDRPIRDVALDIARQWGVGDKQNQGVLLLLAVKDRQSDIETGRGIEPYITDGFAGSTLRTMRPELRGGNYGAALLTAARAMAGQIAQGKGIAFSDAIVPQARPERAEHHSGIPFPLILFGLFFLVWLFSRGGGRRGGPGGGSRGGGGAGDLLTGVLIGNMLGGGRRDNWGGGGFGGFGGGSGGGGFGGFGGGDFGGGGASSNW